MIYDLFILFIFPIMCAVVAWIVSVRLTDPNMILGPVYNLLVNKWNLPEWITKPLIECAYCMAGQYALWVYFVIADYNFLAHVWVVAFAIFSVEVINHKYNNDN